MNKLLIRLERVEKKAASKKPDRKVIILTKGEEEPPNPDNEDRFIIRIGPGEFPKGHPNYLAS